MGKMKDIKGQRFGRLIALSFAGMRNGYATWLCVCDCGNHKTVLSANLIHNKTQSCGCIHLEVMRNRFGTHGDTKSKEYTCWINIKERCTNVNRVDFKNYGARGIKVCERWLYFENFLSDMGRAPSPKHTLDRIDCNGDYEPTNCKWATQKEQQNNRRSNAVLEYNGLKKTKAQWAEELGISYSSLQSRLRRGWTLDKVFSTPTNAYFPTKQ